MGSHKPAPRSCPSASHLKWSLCGAAGLVFAGSEVFPREGAAPCHLTAGSICCKVLTSDRIVLMCLCVLSHFSCVRLFATLWIVVLGILQARILEWVTMPSSRVSSQPRDQTRVSCITGGFFTAEPPGKPIIVTYNLLNFCGISCNSALPFLILFSSVFFFFFSLAKGLSIFLIFLKSQLF